MKLICKNVKTPREAEQFVSWCEREFREKLLDIAGEIISRGNRIITLAGPTCSGKTTTASLIVDEIEKSGRNAVVISIDDFYKDGLRDGIAEGKKIDFDSVNTIDLEYLEAFTADILAGKPVKVPSFDFTTGKRSGYRELIPSEDDIFIFEGIQAVYPEVTRLLGDRFTSVFICVKDDVMYNGVYFSAHEVRFLRRIVRDALFRNTTPEITFMSWDSVRENEEEAIFPNAQNPHFLIDSFLTYELFMIAGIASPMLETVPLGSPYKAVADSLHIRLEKLINDLYDTALVPDNSMFREFIGGRK